MDEINKLTQKVTNGKDNGTSIDTLKDNLLKFIKYPNLFFTDTKVQDKYSSDNTYEKTRNNCEKRTSNCLIEILSGDENVTSYNNNSQGY